MSVISNFATRLYNLLASVVTVNSDAETSLAITIQDQTQNVKVVHATPLGSDAWARLKSVHDESLIHGTFNGSVSKAVWKETINGVETNITDPYLHATSVDGSLVLQAGATLNDLTVLDTYRSPRYEPNRGHLYSNSLWLPSPAALGERDFGVFTGENGAFFRQKTDGLYACREYTTGTVVTTVEELIDPAMLPDWYDPAMGNIYDIQMQLRGVGDYMYYIGSETLKVSILVHTMHMLNKLGRMSISNFALPLAFRCKNLGDNVVIESGCADLTSEGGSAKHRTYGSLSVETESGGIAITGFNTPMLVVHNKISVNGLRNVRDVMAFAISGYSDTKSYLRVWFTRDPSAIILNDQVWTDYGDGFIEYIWYNQPPAATPMSFDTAKAGVTFGGRVPLDGTLISSALFEEAANIYLSPGDYLIFTIHRDTGSGSTAGVTFEFGEEI